MQLANFTVTEGKFETDAGLSIAYTDYQPAEGKGLAPLVYLPGFLRTARDFHRVAIRFATERRVVTIDTRGRGKADRAQAIDAYQIDALIADTWRLADHLGLEKMVLVGIALGAFMGWRMTAANPERILGMVCNDTSTETSSKAGKKMAANADAGFYTLEQAVEKLRTATQHNFPDFGTDDWIAYTLQVYADRDQGYQRDFDPKWMESIARLKEEIPSFWDEFLQIKAPVLILRGANSDYLLPEQVARMTAELPLATAVEIQGRGHPLLLDEPASLAAIRGLLAKIGA